MPFKGPHWVEPEDDACIMRHVARRMEARGRGDFALADAIRTRLLQLGIVLEDRRSRTCWWWTDEISLHVGACGYHWRLGDYWEGGRLAGNRLRNLHDVGVELGDCGHPERGGHPAVNVESGCIEHAVTEEADVAMPDVCGTCRHWKRRSEKREA